MTTRSSLGRFVLRVVAGTALIGTTAQWSKGQVIYTNSPSSYDPFMLTRVAGVCGPDGSATDVQMALGLTVRGWHYGLTSTGSINAVADDFVVSAGELWTIEGIRFFVYQPGAPAPTIGNVRYSICGGSWLGAYPASWSFGPTTLDFPPVFKEHDALPDTCDRRIQMVTMSITPPLVLPSGPYGLAWYTVGGPLPGPFQPPVVVPGLPGKPGANGLHSSGGAFFAPIADVAPQDFVFQLLGTIVCDPAGPADGDMNCDGVVNGADIAAFNLAVIDPAAYAAAYPSCSFCNADINDDGVVDTLDVPPFIDCLLGGPC